MKRTIKSSDAIEELDPVQDILEYDYPDASWPTWYEDTKRRFDKWYNS